jgi:hypothetical protein
LNIELFLIQIFKLITLSILPQKFPECFHRSSYCSLGALGILYTYNSLISPSETLWNRAILAKVWQLVCIESADVELAPNKCVSSLNMRQKQSEARSALQFPSLCYHNTRVLEWKLGLFLHLNSRGILYNMLNINIINLWSGLEWFYEENVIETWS